MYFNKEGTVRWLNGMRFFSVLFMSLCMYVAISLEEGKFQAIFQNESASIFSALNFHSFSQCVLFFGILGVNLYMFVKGVHIKTRGYDKISAFIFSFCMYMGRCYTSTGSVFKVVHNKSHFLLAILFLFGFYFLFEKMIYVLKYFIRKMRNCKLSEKVEKVVCAFNRRSFLLSFFAMIIAWLPYAVIRYPAGIDWDDYYMMKQFLGYSQMKDHWPVFTAALEGSFVWIGETLFSSANIGAFLLVMVEMILAALVLAYTVSFVSKVKGTFDLLPLTLLLGYVFIPCYPSTCTTISKDSFFSIAVVWFVVLLIKCLLIRFEYKYCILLFISSLLMSFLRNNGVYIVLLVGCVLLFAAIRNKKYVLLSICLFGVVLFYQGYTKILLPSTNIQMVVKTQEALSLPLQQTARYVSEHPEAVTEEEKRLIDDVIDFDHLAENYNPLLSDPVKGTYHANTEQLKAYLLGAWLPQFFRYPQSYINATLNHVYGFFYPEAIQHYDSNASGLYLSYQYDEDIKFIQVRILDNLKDRLGRYVKYWEGNAVTMLFGNIAISVWICIYMIIYVVWNRRKLLFICLMPALVSILVCIASPTWWHNGFRYAFPIRMMMPVLLAVFIIECFKAVKTNDRVISKES